MSNSFLSAMFKLFHWQVVYNMENTSKMSGHHIQEWKINILIQIITEVSQERSSIASDILTPVASTSPGHYHVNFRLSNFATRHNQTRGWVQLSVFRWIAILLFSMTTLELTCILILRALRWHFLTALRCSNLPLNSSFQRIKLRSFHCFQMLSVEARISLYWTSLLCRRDYQTHWCWGQWSWGCCTDNLLQSSSPGRWSGCSLDNQWWLLSGRSWIGYTPPLQGWVW